jgi:hypothetical protein
MASCRLIWHLAWLLWTFLYLKFLIANEIYDKVPCYYLLYKKHRVARVTKCVRRPPIPITVLSETFCVMSHIRLRMSFLLMLPWLTKTIVENERLKGYLTVGTVMAALIGSCLLFRRPPDRFYALPNDVMIHVLPRVAFWRRLVFCAFLGISILFFQSIPSNIYQRAPQTPTTNAENYEQTAFMAKKADDGDIQRDVGDWGSDSIPIVVDSACSASMTPFRTDLRNIRPYTSTVAGFGSNKITHVGEVSWCVTDINGKDVFLQDDLCYLAPNAPYRLLCPHNWKKHCNKKRYDAGETEGDQATFMLSPNDSDNDYRLQVNFENLKPLFRHLKPFHLSLKTMTTKKPTTPC